MSCISDKFFKFQIKNFLKFRQISEINAQYCLVHVATLRHSNFVMKTSDLRKILGKYLHYLNKMIKKLKVRKFIFSKVSCF